MVEIKKIETYKFDIENIEQIRTNKFSDNWPVVYIIENGKEAYIGETIDIVNRTKSHYANDERRKLHKIHVIGDEKYNKSATLDIESSLIQYMAADGIFKLQNGNSGLKDHNYYNKKEYRMEFKNLWESLKTIDLANNSISEIENSDLFKYSPYKALNDEQLLISEKIMMLFEENTRTIMVSGRSGTGKTILATYLMKKLLDDPNIKYKNIALVVPMTSLRKTLKKVFRGIKGLNSKMVIGPSDVIKEDYDVLIVDEAHRLKKRTNITNYASFDNVNKKLGLDKNKGTELDWILKSSKHQIFLYDSNQTIKPSDIEIEKFNKLDKCEFKLKTQMRVLGGIEYLNFIDNLFDMRRVEKESFQNYEFKIYSNVETMQNDIKKKDEEYGLSRIVSGFAWKWKTKQNRQKIHTYDIEIDGVKLIWNSTNIDWVNSKNAVNEVGCIHTVQGYDLNYVGVIIGPELYYDKENELLCIDEKEYKDINGKKSIKDQNELKQYIINIYKVLLTRGIRGTYIYAVDRNLREYLESMFNYKYIYENKDFIFKDDVKVADNKEAGEYILDSSKIK